MTYFSIGGNDFFSMETLIACFVVLLIIGIASWVAFFVLRSKDNSLPLQTAKVRILEKPVKKGLVEWFVVEFENGERKKLRNFHGETVIIAVGDEGIMEYRGITIQSFRAFPARK